MTFPGCDQHHCSSWSFLPTLAHALGHDLYPPKLGSPGVQPGAQDLTRTAIASAGTEQADGWSSELQNSKLTVPKRPTRRCLSTADRGKSPKYWTAGYLTNGWWLDADAVLVMPGTASAD